MSLQHLLIATRMAQVLTVLWTWRAMSGSGRRIFMTRTITMTHQIEILKARILVNLGRCAEPRGIITRRESVQEIGAGKGQQIAVILSVFAA